MSGGEGAQVEERPLGRRIARLFLPYKGALAAIFGMILVTSLLTVIGALLMQRIFNNALFLAGGPDLGILLPLVGALIAIPIVNGVLNVAQTYLTETVGSPRWSRCWSSRRSSP